MGWMGFVVEYEMNGTNHYEAYIPEWYWDEENQIDAPITQTNLLTTADLDRYLNIFKGFLRRQKH